MMNDFPGKQYETFGENILSKPRTGLRIIGEWLFNGFVLPILFVILILACIAIIGGLAVLNNIQIVSLPDNVNGGWYV